MTGRLVLALVSLYCGIALFAFDIVREGEPRAQIVVEKGNANSLAAAKELQYFVEKMSGAKLEIANEPGKELQPIFIGAKKQGYALPQFNGSGYDILIGKDYAVLAGSNISYDCKYNEAGVLVSGCNDNGDMHAVSAFLENLGVRFYGPGDEGTIIPRRSTIALEPGRTTREAVFSRREYFGTNGVDEATQQWFLRMKCGGRTPAVYGHTLDAVLKEGDAPQNWLAEEEKGKLFADGNIPRYTDAGYQRACVAWARKFFDAHPEVKQLSLGGPASSLCKYDWRDVEKYKELGLSDRQGYSNMIFDFYKTVAGELKKSHPDRDIIWYSFNSNEVPEQLFNEKLPENVVLGMDELPAAHYVQPRQAGAYFNNLKAMHDAMQPRRKTLQKELWKDYYSADMPSYPEFFAAKLQDTRRQQRAYFDGVCVEVETGADKKIAQLPLMHLMMYVNSKLLWEPDLDLNALLDEYYRLWFGPAACEMKEFHAYAEKLWCSKFSRSIYAEEGCFKPGDLPMLFKLLELAQGKVQPGTVYRRHVDELAAAIAKVKDMYEEHKPMGPYAEASIFLAKSVPDGNLAKYTTKWHKLTPVKPNAAKADKTEVAFGFTEDGAFLFVAARCYSSNMAKLASGVKLPDDKGIFSDERIEVYFNSPRRSWFQVVANSEGAIYDRSFDLDLSQNHKDSLLWSPGAKASVKRFDDRWELELMIPTDGFTRPYPIVKTAWGVNVVRCGKDNAAVSALAPEAGCFPKVQPSKWFRVWRKPVDCDGWPIEDNGYILTYTRDYPGPYKVAKAKGKVDLAGEWDSASWGHLKSVKLGPCMKKAGDRNVHLPDTQAKLQYDDKYLYVMFQVKDQYVQAVAKNDMDSVCQDSCVEFFVRPADVPQYYNFEMSCGGRMLLYEIEFLGGGNVYKPSQEFMNTIERYHSMPALIKKEIQEPVTWRVAYKVPLSFFVERAGINPKLSGQVWTANFFKCADRSTHRHWMCWNPSPGFHFPEHFGTLVFE